ncbi:MAG: DUF1501 domain-containing protein [Planctomycetota bacterium]
MFRLLDDGAQLCDGVTRRQWLVLGSLAAFAGVQTPALASPRPRERAFGKAKAVIVLFLTGGPPQHDTWDPKPDAPDVIRGETRPIATSLPGLSVGELMPRTAAIAHHVCVLRAMSTGDNAHSSSGYAMHTGQAHQPLSFENARPGPPNNAPSLGAIFKTLRSRPGRLPAAVTLPEQIVNNPNLPWPGQDGGYLGQTADPWLLRCDPTAAGFQVAELALPHDVPALRVDNRRTLLDQVNRHFNAIERHDENQAQAFALLRSPSVRHAFDLNQESAPLRERYGSTKFGQSVLLARRLVQAGVPFVQVNYPREAGDTTANSPLWDTHQGHFVRMKNVLMPAMDAAYATLIADLAQRGLLEETLVVLMGEFGRTPRINNDAGRDHWGPVFSIALAGGGVRGGQVIGSSDRVGAFPRDGRVTPQDLHATILHCLGIAADETFRDREGRVLHAASGTVIPQVL